MGRGLEQRAERIAEGAGEQNGKPGKAGAEQLSQEQAEPASEREVAGEVTDIGVQPQSRYRGLRQRVRFTAP